MQDPQDGNRKTRQRSMSVRLAQLRGSLSAQEPGARGIERLARNSCPLLTCLTIAGVSPGTAAVKVLGGFEREGQSPFAIGLGVRFDQTLVGGGAAEVLRLYRDAGTLTAAESLVVDVPRSVPGIDPASMARRRELTLSLMRKKLNRLADAPNVIVKPRLTISLAGVDHDIEPDWLVAADSDPFYVVAEAKSYADRAGMTDGSDIRSACRQAAVGVCALRYALRKLGDPEPERTAGPNGHIVLRRPQTMRPVLRPMTLCLEVVSIERALADAPTVLSEVETQLASFGSGVALDKPAVLNAIAYNYQPSCGEHCALEPYCRSRARSDGNLIILGTRAREALLAAGTVGRALELLEGRGTPPRTAEETRLAQRLRIAGAALRKAVS